jgi:hypothetical protein
MKTTKKGGKGGKGGTKCKKSGKGGKGGTKCKVRTENTPTPNAKRPNPIANKNTTASTPSVDMQKTMQKNMSANKTSSNMSNGGGMSKKSGGRGCTTCSGK